jgi:hypothetical protein
VSERRESLYGLVFTSDLEGIGEPVAARAAGSELPPDLAIAADEDWEDAASAGAPLETSWAERGVSVSLRVRGVGAFDVTRDRVVVRPAPGAREDLVRLFVRYHALGLALRLRGFVVLHGAAVSLAGAAHVWVGASGAGKTSAALAACGAGARFLADEVVALEARGDRFVVRRGVTWPRVDAGAPERLHALARRADAALEAEAPLASVALPGASGGPAVLRGAALAAQILGGYRPELPPIAEEIALRSRLLAELERLRR